MTLKLAKPILVSHGPLDSPGEWASLMLQDAPTFDVTGFQKKIDNTVGLSPSGHSIVRLRWARDCQKWVNTEWDFAGNATKGEMVLKYCAFRVDLEGRPGDFVEVAPPRFVLEQRYEPEQYMPSWDSARYVNVPTDEVPISCRYCYALDWIDSYKSEGVSLVCRHCAEITIVPFVRRDIVGPAPRDGWYNLLRVIGVFNKHTKEKFGPWGGYRVPDQRDITDLREAVHLRNKDPECDPFQPLSDAAMNQARALGMQRIDEQRKAINA